MRFEISYQAGPPHVVELSGSVAVFGRDPGCDVVLNDGKCSRRHATVEELPEGLVVRDAGDEARDPGVLDATGGAPLAPEVLAPAGRQVLDLWGQLPHAPRSVGRSADDRGAFSRRIAARGGQSGLLGTGGET